MPNTSPASIDISQARFIHFFGIGGIGVSALARMFLAEGRQVSGSDLNPSEITAELTAAGAQITPGQDISHLPPATDLIIYTAAIEVAAPELFRQIKTLKIPSLSYPEALGVVSRHKKTIAVAGTHGKTTTTAMLAKILLAAHLDPTVIIGTLLPDQKSNFIAGQSEYLLVEADEYRRAFLNLYPHILIINNLDLDHLDYYRDLPDIQSAFASLISQIVPGGFLITNPSDPHITPLLAAFQSTNPSSDVTIMDYTTANLSTLKLKVPGEHNRQNASAALTAAIALHLEPAASLHALSDFSGTWRRFEHLGQTASGALVYDDYAHNPQKISAALAGAREMYPDKKIIAVFQPHLYSRTKALRAELTAAIAPADQIIILPIYPAREAFDPTISSDLLAADISAAHPGKPVVAISPAVPAESIFQALDAALSSAGPDSLILFLGAGDGYLMARKLLVSK